MIYALPFNNCQLQIEQVDIQATDASDMNKPYITQTFFMQFHLDFFDDL